jgi:hypothetical protein
MDYVTAKIALSGDVANIMYRGPDRPVSWPEVTVLQYIHGDDAVYDCEFVRSEVSSAQVEKRRLLGVYGATAINELFPGARPIMEMDFPGDKVEAGRMRPTKIEPPTRETRERLVGEAEENEVAMTMPQRRGGKQREEV